MDNIYLINTETLEYPIFEGDYRVSNSNVSFTTPLVPLEPYAWVVSSPEPIYDFIVEGLKEITPTNKNGVWYQTWEVYSLNPEQVANNISARNNNIKRDIVRRTQQRLDTFARTRNYDNILSLCTYATSTNPKFAKEGQYGVEIRDATWSKLYEILDQVDGDTRSMPTSYEEIESELPQLQWPE